MKKPYTEEKGFIHPDPALQSKTDFNKMKVEKSTETLYDYKITRIDITDIFIKVINNDKWVTHLIDEDKKFNNSFDGGVNIKVNGDIYEIVFKYEIKRKTIECISSDFLNDSLCQYEYSKIDSLEFEVYKDSEEILIHDLDFKIEFNEYKVMDSLEA